MYQTKGRSNRVHSVSLCCRTIGHETRGIRNRLFTLELLSWREVEKNALAGREEPSDSTSTGRRQRELILTRENSIQCHPSAN
jgi:hypothetical protein